MNVERPTRLKRLDPLVAAALLVWLAWLTGSAVICWQFRARVMHPHFLPLVSLLCVQLLATATAVSLGLWRIVRGPRRWAAFSWTLAAIIPALLWAAHTSYVFAAVADRRMPLDWAGKTAVVAGAGLADAEMRLRYPRRLAGERVVMIYDELADPARDLAAMDRHVAKLEDVLGRPMRGKVHWVRGRLLGMDARAFLGLALGGAVDPEGDGPNETDRHEVAHVVLNHHLPADAEPPALLSEGWAVCQEGRPVESSFGFAWCMRRDGELPTLRELLGPDRYARMDSPAYYYGGVVVDYLLRRYGAEKFFELYSTCRKKTFAADFRRAFGLGLDELEAEFWEDADRRIRERIEAIDTSAWPPLDLPDPGPTDEAAREAFLAHYPEAAEKLRIAYTHARITAEDVNELHEADGRRRRPPSVAELEVARNGDRASVVCRSEHATNALVATLDASFHVARAPDDERFRIERFQPASRAGYRRIVGQIDELDRFLHTPYKMVNRSVLDWMAEPRFRIVGVVRSVEDDGELLTVHFRNPTLDLQGGSLLEAGWFSVRPDDGWAIQEYELHVQSPEGLQAVWEVRAEYGVAQHGVPALDRVTVQMRGKTGVTRQITTKVKSLEFGPVPEEEFELGAFGHKPPRKEIVRQKSVWHRILRATGWTLTAVVLTLLLTVTMHFTVRRPIIRRRQRDVPPTNDAERSP